MMGWRRAASAVLIAAFGLMEAGIASAQSGAAPIEEPIAAGRRFLPVDEAGPWSGVGRLNVAGYRASFCTAALISPDRLLTAAHCVVSARTGRPYQITDLHFTAGWRTGTFTAHRRITSVAIHPDYRIGGSVMENVPSDLAVLTLESPISPFEVKNYPTAGAPAQGADVTLLSYGRDRAHALSIQEPCQVRGLRPGAAVLNCDVTYGASGSPVFGDGPAGPEIVAVISAMSVFPEGGKVAHAALLGPALDAVMGIGGASSAGPAALVSAPERRGVSRPPSAGGSLLPGGKRAPSN